MTVRYVDVPLFSDFHYTYSITLEGNSYNLEFLYNERMELYTLTMYSADGSLLVAGHAVVPNYPIFGDYALPDLDGFFFMEPISEIEAEAYKTYPAQIHKYYRMVYLYDDGE
jgi:hypothetical protein